MQHMLQIDAVVLDGVLAAPGRRAFPLRIRVEEGSRENQLVHDVGLVQHQRGHIVRANEGQRLLDAGTLPHAPAMHFEATEGEAHAAVLQRAYFPAPAVRPCSRNRLSVKASSSTGKMVSTPPAAMTPQISCSSLFTLNRFRSEEH